MPLRENPVNGRLVSRQRIHALEKMAEGRCAQCPKPRNKYEVYCDDCQAIRSARRRRPRN